MRCMVMVRATDESESETQAMPNAEIMAAMNRFNEELVQAGVMLAGEGLKPSRDGKRVRFAGGRQQVVDGPFAETRELIAGFWLWQVRSMDEALEWARRCPAPFVGECEIEIRPLYEEADFAEIMSPELRESEARLRGQIAERTR
ncbi:YciI family protein [Dyella lutea]|uniref:YciI family protein n=1 Tax=Dyella lutea TaxID=2950441 RepID=A0ABT1FAC5_9GAMM|nr:YciI family protein [Dyella lutea]MCP1374333.1 YciI family protein [Dyella lutea]